MNEWFLGLSIRYAGSPCHTVFTNNVKLLILHVEKRFNARFALKGFGDSKFKVCHFVKCVVFHLGISVIDRSLTTRKTYSCLKTA